MEVCWFAYMQIEGLKTDSHQEIINCHRAIASASDFCAVLLLLPIYELSWTKFSDPDSQQNETPS